MLFTEKNGIIIRMLLDLQDAHLSDLVTVKYGKDHREYCQRWRYSLLWIASVE